MQKIIGFIGFGNMAQAMARGLIGSRTILANNIFASKRDITQKEEIEKEFNIHIVNSNKEVARKSDYLILAVKPNIYKNILKEIKDDIKQNGVVIGIGAGISSKFLKNNLNPGTKYIKAMPNTPAMVGEGMSAISSIDQLTEEELKDILQIFNSFGKVEIVDESLMDGFTALCGSSPAYIYILIEAMADAGVMEGIPRSIAYTMAAQSVLGSAKMVLETGIHPAQLKDNVCSPGGTTIEAVASLEENGFRTAIIEAIKVCAEKSRKINL